MMAITFGEHIVNMAECVVTPYWARCAAFIFSTLNRCQWVASPRPSPSLGFQLKKHISSRHERDGIALNKSEGNKKD